MTEGPGCLLAIGWMLSSDTSGWLQFPATQKAVHNMAFASSSPAKEPLSPVS